MHYGAAKHTLIRGLRRSHTTPKATIRGLRHSHTTPRRETPCGSRASGENCAVAKPGAQITGRSESARPTA